MYLVSPTGEEKEEQSKKRKMKMKNKKEKDHTLVPSFVILTSC